MPQGHMEAEAGSLMEGLLNDLAKGQGDVWPATVITRA